MEFDFDCDMILHFDDKGIGTIESNQENYVKSDVIGKLKVIIDKVCSLSATVFSYYLNIATERWK